MQPFHAIDDGRWAITRLGPERIRTTYAFRSLLDAGTTLAFGLDWPVGPLRPVTGIYAAGTCRTIDGKTPRAGCPGRRSRSKKPSRPIPAAPPTPSQSTFV